MMIGCAYCGSVGEEILSHGSDSICCVTIISEEEADMVREVYRAWGEGHVFVDWTEDGPTLDSDHAYTFGQHGRVEAPESTDHGRRMVRLIWPDGSPIDDSRGIWKRCDECGPDGRLIQVEDED